MNKKNKEPEETKEEKKISKNLTEITLKRLAELSLPTKRK
jgi:hypothetical protein